LEDHRHNVKLEDHRPKGPIIHTKKMKEISTERILKLYITSI